MPAAFSDPPKGRDAATDRQIAKMSVSLEWSISLSHTFTFTYRLILIIHTLAHYTTLLLHYSALLRMLVVVVWMCKQ